MLSTPEPFLSAELDYRRERIMADFAPRRTSRRRRTLRQVSRWQRTVSQRKSPVASPSH